MAKLNKKERSNAVNIGINGGVLESKRYSIIDRHTKYTAQKMA